MALKPEWCGRRAAGSASGRPPPPGAAAPESGPSVFLPAVHAAALGGANCSAARGWLTRPLEGWCTGFAAGAPSSPGRAAVRPPRLSAWPPSLRFLGLGKIGEVGEAWVLPLCWPRSAPRGGQLALRGSVVVVMLLHRCRSDGPMRGAVRSGWYVVTSMLGLASMLLRIEIQSRSKLVYVCSRGGRWVNTTLCRTHGLKSGACRRPETERQGLPVRPSHDSVRRSESSLHTMDRPSSSIRLSGPPGVVTCASSLRCELHSRLQSPRVTAEDLSKTVPRDTGTAGSVPAMK